MDHIALLTILLTFAHVFFCTLCWKRIKNYMPHRLLNPRTTLPSSLSSSSSASHNVREPNGTRHHYRHSRAEYDGHHMIDIQAIYSPDDASIRHTEWRAPPPAYNEITLYTNPTAEFEATIHSQTSKLRIQLGTKNLQMVAMDSAESASWEGHVIGGLPSYDDVIKEQSESEMIHPNY